MRDILGAKVQKGEHKQINISIGYLANGLELTIPLHVYRGQEDGPTLLMTSLAHGDATTGFEIIRQTVQQLDLNKLKGTVLAMPCLNPIAFEWDSRNTPIDMQNMNRAFPGKADGWLTDRLAAAVSPVCDYADALLDWHGGGYGSAINYVLYDYVEGELGERVKEMAFNYGLEILYNGKPAGPSYQYEGSLVKYMLGLGKPGIIPEVGTGMGLKIDIIESSVRGNFNTMKWMGMIEGKPILPKKQYLIKHRPLLRPSNGGMFYPICGPEYLNKWVKKGTVIAQVRNVRTMEVIEEIIAPCEKTVFMNMRGLMTKVHPGDYAYILGDLSTAEVHEND
ncbi:succinylglutamate desuccinylase/aspartoacylase family protein [Paratissierella segnis]|jgi:hypothetical protein|uniref:Succinylglutamate desuccinylase/aspartoacylase family protein n=1 Tax=Paratissierella segnis TaxID=2763679 RepID=A0A926IIY0_9FIRM|nr:succinylglutamate desuccinylase/aspartoacylase family protein [Paratissierella segnis]MBC8587444.1 succinylglutamate desuccinylase/aspartoacylase family protein [Paratissierella segnis]